jgi:hypothetical protein
MAFNKKQREEIHRKLDGHCGYCGKQITLKQMQVDHMNPKSLRTLNMVLFEGQVTDNTDHIDNLMPTCRRCNHYKRADTVESFRKSMAYLHDRLMKIYIVNVGVDFGMMEIKPFDGVFYFERVAKNLLKVETITPIENEM